MVNAWISVANIFPDWNLIISGVAEDENYFKKIVKSINNAKLSHRVKYTDFVNGQDRIDVYTASDLFILPSHTENYGIVIAEAMAAKLPVITTTGTPWISIKDNDAGWYVKLSQQNITASVNEALSMDYSLLRAKGLHGFDLIEKHDWAGRSKKMKELYNYILHGGSCPKFIYYD